MEVLQRILSKRNIKTTTSTKVQAKEQKDSYQVQNQQITNKEYNCTECKDTGWIFIDRNTVKPCNCVDKDYIEKLWKNFGINPKQIKKISEYKNYNELTLEAKSEAIRYIEQFRSIRETRNNGFALLGQPGAGKTHLILAIGKILLDRKVQVIYMPYLEAIRELKLNTLNDEVYNKLMNRYCKCKVLIIDDLFKDKVKNGKVVGELNEADMKHIYPIINYRYNNNLPMIISSECDSKMLLRIDEALGGRILECCSDFKVTFNVSCNYRINRGN